MAPPWVELAVAPVGASGYLQPGSEGGGPPRDQCRAMLEQTWGETEHPGGLRGPQCMGDVRSEEVSMRLGHLEEALVAEGADPAHCTSHHTRMQNVPPGHIRHQNMRKCTRLQCCMARKSTS